MNDIQTTEAPQAPQAQTIRVSAGFGGVQAAPHSIDGHRVLVAFSRAGVGGDDGYMVIFNTSDELTSNTVGLFRWNDGMPTLTVTERDMEWIDALMLADEMTWS